MKTMSPDGNSHNSTPLHRINSHTFGKTLSRSKILGKHAHITKSDPYLQDLNTWRYHFPKSGVMEISQGGGTQGDSFSKDKENPNLRILRQIIQEWIDAIPDLPYFREIKARRDEVDIAEMLYKSLGPFSDKGNYGLASYQQTKLANFLRDLTISLCKKADTAKLVEMGYIDDPEEYAFKLSCESYRKDQLAFLTSDKSLQHRYLKVMCVWLRREMKFFNEIKAYYAKRKGANAGADHASKSEASFESLFYGKTQVIQRFWEILLSKDAIDEERNWKYNHLKSSIVACFAALEALGAIRSISNKAELRRIVAREIQFEGDAKLFRNPFRDEDFEEFKAMFAGMLD